jgi:hypothetical protein
LNSFFVIADRINGSIFYFRRFERKNADLRILALYSEWKQIFAFRQTPFPFFATEKPRVIPTYGKPRCGFNLFGNAGLGKNP